ncbi:MAG: calcium/sodium antiporter [Pseudoflavonifractor sp.]|nr:calcium/sodium antiporter [Pseudoflavonifractor sp.]
MDYILLIAGLALLLAGANFIVESSVAIAQRAKISNFIIGLTIVGIGTSSPELLISASSALKGAGDMALGNIIGSNICNTLLILGVTALILPFSIERSTLRRDIPMSIFGAILIFILVYDSLLPRIDENILSRFDGFVLLVIFAIYMWLITRKKGSEKKELEENSVSRFSGRSPWLLWTIAILSLGALIYGGTLFIDSATALARQWGVSDSVIAITLLAVGTSLPELITCIVAASKGNAQLALGNVIGSNIFNIFMILGVSSMLRPMTVSGIGVVDFAVLIIASVLTFLVAFTFGKHKFDRIEGAIFLLIYAGYTTYLIIK